MKLTTGIDIIEIERFKQAQRRWGERFLERIFTQKEIADCGRKLKKFSYFAAGFAGKEAISKALQLSWEKGLNWKEIEVINAPSGSSSVILQGHAKEIAENLKISEISLSISRSRNYAVACAVAIGG